MAYQDIDHVSSTAMADSLGPSSSCASMQGRLDILELLLPVTC